MWGIVVRHQATLMRAFVSVAILYVYVFCVFYILPLLSVATASINLAVGTLLVICSLLSYYKACLVNAGSVPQDWLENAQTKLRERQKENQPDSKSDMLDFRLHDTADPLDPPITWCGKCNALKPPRAHHCKVCNKCILKMDHHCFFTGNCVGFDNHKFFLLFLGYTGIVTFQGIGLWLVYLYALISKTIEPGVGIILLAVLDLILSYIGGLYVFLMACEQWKMAMSGDTTIEKKKFKVWRRRAKTELNQKFQLPFNSGTKANFEIIFGSTRFWFNPLSNPRLLTNGCQWTATDSFKYQALKLCN